MFWLFLGPFWCNLFFPLLHHNGLFLYNNDIYNHPPILKVSSHHKRQSFTMSLTIESYKLVDRNYLQRLLEQTNEDCHCSNCMFCVRGKLIQAELLSNGYQTVIKNKDVKCWKISETANSLSVSPSDQWFFAVVLAFAEIKDYLSLLRMSLLVYHRKLSYAISLSIWSVFFAVVICNFSLHLISDFLQLL